MHITQISQDFSVSPQITAADVAEIANAGFKSIICNRPDFEEPTQPDSMILQMPHMKRD